MTEKLYFKDMYLKEFDATVIRVDGNNVYLDKTAFYPTGGGQPSDTGKLIAAGKEMPVIDVKKVEDDVVHVLAEGSTLKKGDSVHGIMDWDKRYAYMRYHTAVHIIDAVATKSYADKGLITGSQMYADRARMDFDMPTLNREIAQKIIDEANREVGACRNVIAKDFSKAEALAIPNLARTAPGRELISRLDVVRVVEIDGLDSQADGGLHVRNSKDVGKIVLNSYKNNGSHSKRIEIRLEWL